MARGRVGANAAYGGPNQRVENPAEMTMNETRRRRATAASGPFEPTSNDEQILTSFISVRTDPTLATTSDLNLRGEPVPSSFPAHPLPARVVCRGRG